MFKILRGENKTRDKIIKFSIMVLLILLPFLDMLRTTGIRHIEILGISIIEIWNILLIGVAFLLTLFKCNWKQLLFVFGYILILIAYIILHYMHIVTFDTSLFPRANFNFLTESFYIVRVYILPLALLFVLIKNKDIFDKKFYFKIVKIVIAIISFSIIALNILKLSFISYNEGHSFNTENIFDYFLFSGDFRQLSSRGWFDSANELSAIMFMLFPINVYLLFKEGKRFNIALFVGQFIAMILLGTRTSAVGSVLIVLAIGLLYVIFVLFKKEPVNLNFVKVFGFCSIICIAFFSISPFMIARLNEGKADFSIKNQEAYTSLEEDKNDEKKLSKLFEKYRDEYMINELYLKIYPYKVDSQFWLKMASRDKALNNDSRRMKADILARVKERNNDDLDTYFGLGYTLNMIDGERDYVYQFYLFGIIGIIVLMGPYFAMLLYLIVRSLFNLKKCFKLDVACSLMGVVLGLLIAYYSGHVFGWVSPMMWLTVMIGISTFVVLENINKKDKELEEETSNNKKSFENFLRNM